MTKRQWAPWPQQQTQEQQEPEGQYQESQQGQQHQQQEQQQGQQNQQQEQQQQSHNSTTAQPQNPQRVPSSRVATVFLGPEPEDLKPDPNSPIVTVCCTSLMKKRDFDSWVKDRKEKGQPTTHYIIDRNENGERWREVIEPYLDSETESESETETETETKPDAAKASQPAPKSTFRTTIPLRGSEQTFRQSSIDISSSKPEPDVKGGDINTTTNSSGTQTTFNNTADLEQEVRGGDIKASLGTGTSSTSINSSSHNNSRGASSNDSESDSENRLSKEDPLCQFWTNLLNKGRKSDEKAKMEEKENEEEKEKGD